MKLPTCVAAPVHADWMFLVLLHAMISTFSKAILIFLVEFDDTLPAAYAQAYFSLKEGLEALFDRPVDLVTESSLTNPYFLRRATAKRQTVYVS